MVWIGLKYLWLIMIRIKYKILGLIWNVDRININKVYWKLLYFFFWVLKCWFGGLGWSFCCICSFFGVFLFIYFIFFYSSLKLEVYIYNIVVKLMCYNVFFSFFEFGIFLVGKIKFYDVKIYFIYLIYCMLDYIK